MNINKKGQVTPFIIIGIVIVIIAVLLVVFMKPQISKPTVTTTAQLDPIRDYVEECIKIKGDEALGLIAKNGGVTEVEANEDLRNLYFVHYKDKDQYYGNDPDKQYDVRLWCLTNYYESCSRHFFDSDVENNILDYVNLNIQGCLQGLSQFPNINYNIADRKLDVAIGKYNTIITLDLPVTFEKGNQELKRFSYTFNKPLGRFLEVADQIIDRGETVNPLGDVPINLLTGPDGYFPDLLPIIHWSEDKNIHWSEDKNEIYVLQLKDDFADTNYKFQFAVRGWVS